MTTNCRLREELEQARAELAELKSAQRLKARDLLGLYKQPIRVPFSDEQIEKMAEAAYDVRNGGGKYAWAIDATDEGKIRWRSAIRAAVAAGGLEPCPDVALQKDTTEIDALRTKLARVSAKSGRRRTALKMLNKTVAAQSDLIQRFLRAGKEPVAPTSPALHPGETVEGVVMERDHYRVQLEREQEWVKQYKQDRDDALAELAALRERAEQAEAERDDLQCESSIIGELRAILGLGWCESIFQRCKELAALRDEIDDDNTNAAAVNDLLIQVQNLTSELAALRERDSVPVKVRWSVTAKEADDFHLRLQDRSTETVEDTHDLMDYLAAHAVIDVPAGVPSVEELVVIGGDAHWERMQLDADEDQHEIARVDAILDYLTPYLREPVGWELDVTWEKLYNTYQKAPQGNQGSWKAVLDLCRSRIRPTYECKECANWKAHAAAIEDSSFDMIKRINLARAALEGE